MLKKEKKPKDDSEYIAKEINRMLNSASYTKRDVRKFIEQNADKLSPKNTVEQAVNQQKRDLLRKLAVFGAGAVGFTALSKLANADVLINANGVFKDGVEYSMGGIPYRIVAASNASDESKQKADYVCDGTDDNVEIQSATDDLPSSGGIVFLTEGTYNFGDGRVYLYKPVSVIGSYYGTTISSTGIMFYPQTSIDYLVLKDFNVDAQGSLVRLIYTATYYGKKVTKFMMISNIRNLNTTKHLYIDPSYYGLGGSSSAAVLDMFVAERLYGKININFSAGGKVYKKFINDSYVDMLSEHTVQSGAYLFVCNTISDYVGNIYSNAFFANVQLLTGSIYWRANEFFGTNIGINTTSNIAFNGTSSSKVKLVNSSIVANNITFATADEISIENSYISDTYYDATNDFLINVYSINKLKLNNVVINANSVSGNFIFGCSSSHSNGDFVADNIELVNASNITNLVNAERFNNVYIGSVRYV